MNVQSVGQPWWDDKPAVVVGGGPSVRDFPFNSLRGRFHTVGPNVSGFALNTDALITIDKNVPHRYRQQIEAYAKRGGEAWMAMPPNYEREPVIGARYMERRRGTLSTKLTEVYGCHSGFAALNFCVLKRAKTIYLLGIDMCTTKDGRTHWHDVYGKPNPARASRQLSRWAREFDNAAPVLKDLGIDVITVVGSPTSTVKCFPTMTQAEFLDSLEQAA